MTNSRQTMMMMIIETHIRCSSITQQYNHVSVYSKIHTHTLCSNNIQSKTLNMEFHMFLSISLSLILSHYYYFSCFARTTIYNLDRSGILSYVDFDCRCRRRQLVSQSVSQQRNEINFNSLCAPLMIYTILSQLIFFFFFVKYKS